MTENDFRRESEAVGVGLPVDGRGRLSAMAWLISRRGSSNSSILSRYLFTAAQSSWDSPRSALSLAMRCAIWTIRPFNKLASPFEGAVACITSLWLCANSSVSSTSIAESVNDGVKRWPRTSGVSAVIMPSAQAAGIN